MGQRRQYVHFVGNRWSHRILRPERERGCAPSLSVCPATSSGSIASPLHVPCASVRRHRAAFQAAYQNRQPVGTHESPSGASGAGLSTPFPDASSIRMREVIVLPGLPHLATTTAAMISSSTRSSAPTHLVFFVRSPVIRHRLPKGSFEVRSLGHWLGVSLSLRFYLPAAWPAARHL